LDGHELVADAVGSSKSSKTANESATLLGVLEFLMERAGLHRHVETTQLKWLDVWKRLDHSLGGVRLRGLGGGPLRELVYVVPYFEYNDRKRIEILETFSVQFPTTATTVPRFLVLGELKQLKNDDSGTLSGEVKHLPCGDILSDVLKVELARRHPHAKGVHSGKTERGIIGLFLVERVGRGKLRAIDAALTLVSRDYIPCDSGYEVCIANLLIKAGRRFEKPMGRDPLTDMLPDFILLDTDPVTYLEVWGLDSDDYNKRKTQKRLLYRSNGMRLWEWDARRDKFPPAFPAAAA
jgi:hypothetical protein